jgi:hypothetical protein
MSLTSKLYKKMGDQNSLVNILKFHDVLQRRILHNANSIANYIDLCSAKLCMSPLAAVFPFGHVPFSSKTSFISWLAYIAH